MLKDIQDLNTPGILKGLNTQYNILSLQKDQSPNMMNVVVNYDGSIEKRLGTNTQNTTAIVPVIGKSFVPDGAGTDSLITSIGAWYNFEELSGVRYSQFNSIDLTPVNDPTNTSGKIDKGVLFSASGEQCLINTGNSVYLSGSGHNLSLSAWIYLTTTASTFEYPIIAKRNVAYKIAGVVTADSYDALVLNMDGNGTSFVDSSTSNVKTISPQGNASQYSYKFNKTAGFFNGTTDYIQVPNSADWDFGANDFTVEWWEFRLETTAGKGAIARDATTSYPAFALGYIAGANLSVYMSSNGSSWDIANAKTLGAVTINTWNHLAVCRSNNTFRLFKNGVQTDTWTSDKTLAANANPLSIGRTISSGYYHGWIKELRISNTPRYNSAFSVQTTQFTSDANTKLLLHFDNPSAIGPISPAIYMGGSGYLTTAGTDLILAGTDFTLESFVNFGIWPPTGKGYAIFGNGAGEPNNSYWLAVNATPGICFSYYTTGTVKVDASFTIPITPSANKWYHIAVARSSTTLQGFWDGVSCGTAVMGTASIFSPVSSLTIGGVGGYRFHSGWLKGIRMSMNTARYVSSFNPNQSEFDVDSYTKFYVKANETNGAVSFTDSETVPKAIAVSNAVIQFKEDYRSCIIKDDGNSKHSPYCLGKAKVDFFSPFGTGAMYGTVAGAGHLEVAANVDWRFGTGDYTYECYFRNEASAWTYLNLIDCSVYNPSTSSGGWSIAIDNATTPRINTGGSSQSDWDYATVPAMQLNTWYHIAVSRSATTLKFFLNGSAYLSETDSYNYNPNRKVQIGRFLYTYDNSESSNFEGRIDAVRIAKGKARYTSTFDPPDYSTSIPDQFEYSLYVNTANIVQFDVSSSGLVAEGSVLASSFGALSVGTWYNVVAYAITDVRLGVSVNFANLNTSLWAKSITNGTSTFSVGGLYQDTARRYIDATMDCVGVWNLAVSNSMRANLYNSGSGNYYHSSFETYPWAAFDFGASSLRWLVCAAGTGVYASSNLGLTWVCIATDRSATYQYLDRSKNVLVLTSDAYDEPLYWSGSAGTYAAIIGSSSPHCKYSINFSGYLILLNSNTRKRSFNYIDENVQISSTAWLNFDIPSSADDEITACFILRRYLYVSTRYKVFRVSYVGGNPDWQYVEVKNWGFMPRTVKKIVVTNNQTGQGFYYSIGEVVVGLSYDRKLRIFDGSGDQIISNNIEKDNGLCEFSLENISYCGSGPVISFAEVDANQNVYKLCLAVGQNSDQTTHMINYDGRSMSLYPFSNQNYNCMCMAESANRRFLMAFDRSGFCHMLDSGNLDANTTPIYDVFESPVLFDKTPSQSAKAHQTDFFFSSTTSGAIFYEDRDDFSNEYKFRRRFVVSGSSKKMLHYESVDVPETYNAYQFRLSTSGGTSNPWRLQRYDHFTKGLGIGRNSYD